MLILVYLFNSVFGGLWTLSFRVKLAIAIKIIRCPNIYSMCIIDPKLVDASS